MSEMNLHEWARMHVRRRDNHRRLVLVRGLSRHFSGAANVPPDAAFDIRTGVPAALLRQLPTSALQALALRRTHALHVARLDPTMLSVLYDTTEVH